MMPSGQDTAADVLEQAKGTRKVPAVIGSVKSSNVLTPLQKTGAEGVRRQLGLYRDSQE